MASNPSYPSSKLQPQPRIVPNEPAKTVNEALANSKRQVDASK
jgi:hypothetical protein